MLGRSLKMAFWIFHDHLGLLLIANFIWALAIAIPLGMAMPAFFTGDIELIALVGLPLLYIALFVSNPVFGAGLAHLIKVLIDRRDGSLADFFTGIRLYGLRAAGIGACYAVLLIALGTSAWFYAAKLQSSMPILGFSISAFAVWCMLVVALTAQFVLPALVQKKAGVFATLRLVVLLALANPLLAAGIAIQSMMLTIIVAIVVPLFFAGYGAAILSIGSAAYELLSRKYSPDATTIAEADDDYLNRGLKDLFFPWKS